MTDTITNQTDLYPWQQEALATWRSNDRRGVVEAVTGTGKTRVGVAAIEEAHGAELKSLVLVPSVALMDQWIAAIEGLLPGTTVGRWGNGHHTPMSYCEGRYG